MPTILWNNIIKCLIHSGLVVMTGPFLFPSPQFLKLLLLVQYAEDSLFISKK